MVTAQNELPDEKAQGHVLSDLKDDHEINQRFMAAVNALLDPAVGSDIVAEFDYDLGNTLNYIAVMRSHHQLTVDPIASLQAWLRETTGPALANELIRSHGPQPPNASSLMVMYRGQIFSWQYNNRHRRDNPTVEWSTLIKKQPWLEWDRKQGKYWVRYNTSAGLLSTFDYAERIFLYRGTVPQEGDLLSFLKQGCPKNQFSKLFGSTRPTTHLHQVLEKFQLEPSTECADFRGQVIAAFNEDLRGSRYSSGALFFSAEREYALRFSKGALLTLLTTRAQLERLLATDALYAGTETGTEFAFIGPEGLNALVDSFQGARPLEPGINQVGNSRSHPIWQ